MSNALEVVKNAPLRQVKSVKDLLWNEQAKQQLAAVAARHMNAERLMRVTATAIRQTPKLQQCDPMSFLGALMQSAALGLECNTILGHAFLVPFENKRKGITEVQLIVGWKGLVDLARRSGHIVSIHAGIHYSDDETTGGLWEYEEGTEARLRHRNGDMQGRKLHAYAIAKLKDGGNAYVVLPWAHVMRVRDGSQGYQTAVRYGKKDTPWIAHEDEMAKKTAIRALAKYLPMSVEMVDAMTVDEKAADYRAFAMDPTQGIAPVQEDFIEGEAEEAEPARIEQNRAPYPVQEEVRKPTRAELQKQYREQQAARNPAQEPRKSEVYNPPKEEAKAAAAPVQAQQEEPEPEVTEDPDFADVEITQQQASEAEAIDPYSTPFGKTFLKDVTDMGWDAAWDFHGDQIQTLKANDPHFHAALMAEARQIDPNAPEA